MDKNKECFALDLDQLDMVTGGAMGFMEEIPDSCGCPRCNKFDKVIHIDAGYYECLDCRILYTTDGRIWEAD